MCTFCACLSPDMQCRTVTKRHFSFLNVLQLALKHGSIGFLRFFASDKVPMFVMPSCPHIIFIDRKHENLCKY